MSARRPLSIAAVCSLALLGGCGGGGGGGRKLDMKPIERGIEQGIERQHPNVTVVSVKCPRGVAAKKGQVFKCRVTSANPHLETDATVTQVDESGRVRYFVP